MYSDVCNMLYCGVIYILNQFQGMTLYFEARMTHAKEYSRLLYGICAWQL